MQKYQQILLTILLTLIGSNSLAVVYLTPDLLTPRDMLKSNFQSGWVYQAGDNAEWALPEYDDSNWIKLEKTEYKVKELPENIFADIGWYRLNLAVDSTLFGETIASDMRIAGAAEIYLNGKLVQKWGEIGSNKESTKQLYAYNKSIKLLKLGNTTNQTIAIRFVDYYRSEIYDEIGIIGFSLFLSNHQDYQNYLSQFYRSSWGVLAFTFGISMAITLLHTLLFIFFPKEKSNLYYAAFVLSQMMIMMGTTIFFGDPTLETLRIRYFIFKVGLVGTAIFCVMFTYSIFRDKQPKITKYVIGAGIVIILFANYISTSLIYIFTMLILPISGIEIFNAWRHKKQGAKIIIDGLFLAMIFFFYQMLADMEIIPRFIPFLPIYQEYLVGVLILVITMSVFLAWRVGKTNSDLENKLVQLEELSEKTLRQEREAQEEKLRVKTLEMENQRKDLELEEARKREALMKELEDTNTELELMNKELIQTQAQLVQSEKMASLGILTAGIAHEINNPIGVINSSQDTLQSASTKLQNILEEEFQETYQNHDKLKVIVQAIKSVSSTIKTAGDRVASIVKKMRSFAHLDEAELQRSDIHQGIDDTISMLTNELGEKIKIVNDFDDSIKPFNFYPSQLNQVFLNVILNARQAIADEGEIRVKTSLNDKSVMIEISDNGKGISKTNLEHIFDPGFTTKGVGVGVGLGLSICYNIIQDHKGKISVESEINNGTTVKINLPYNS